MRGDFWCSDNFFYHVYSYTQDCFKCEHLPVRSIYFIMYFPVCAAQFLSLKLILAQVEKLLK